MRQSALFAFAGTTIALAAIGTLTERGNAIARTKTAPLQTVERKSSGDHPIYGPVKLSGNDVRALLAERANPTEHREENEEEANEGYGIVQKRGPTLRVTDPALRAIGDGQPRPPKPGPPSPPMQTPTPALSWEATGMTNGEPPDPQIAVSTTHVVVASQNTLGFFQKDGTSLGTTAIEDFFKPLGLGSGTDPNQGLPSHTRSDPRLIFDEYRKVFWLIKTGGNSGAPQKTVRGRVYVAVSTSENPLGDPANPSQPAWNLYWWDVAPEWHVPNSKIYQTGDIGDYPSIGIDPVDFHQTIPICNRPDPTTAVPKPSCAARYSVLVTAPAKDLVAGTAAPGQYNGTYWIFYDQNLNMMTGVVQPTVHHGKTDWAYYVGRTDNNKLLIWRLQTQAKVFPAQPAVVQLWGKFPAFAASVPDAPQSPAGSLPIYMSNLGTNALKSVYRDGMLHIVTNDAWAWFPGQAALNSIHLIRLSVSEIFSADNPTGKTITGGGPHDINRVFGKNNVLEDNPELDRMYYGWAAIEVNKNDDMVIIYARTGTTIFPQARFSTYYNSEPDIRPSRQLRAGEETYSSSTSNTCGANQTSPCPHRWGDLAGASVDPADDTSIWIVHQYAKKGPKPDYGIWVGKVTP